VPEPSSSRRGGGDLVVEGGTVERRLARRPPLGHTKAALVAL